MKTAPSLLKALLVCFVLIAAAAACCKHQNEPDPLPPTEKDTQRGFSQKTEDVVVEMPEEVVYVKEDINEDLQSYNPESGTISFSNSEELERQNIKAGDILYSAQRTEKAPDGYSLRVTGVSRQGNTVTYQTEPASILEVFQHLEEKGTIDFGTIRQEDLTLPVYTSGGNSANTKVGVEGLDISVATADDVYSFSHTDESTSFSWVMYRQYCASNPNQVAFQVTVGLTIYHTVKEDKSTILVDSGTMVLYTEAEMGVTASLSLECGPELSEEEMNVELSTLNRNFLDKKYDIKCFPVPVSFARVAVNPWIVVSLQFNMGIDGEIKLETGFEKTSCAFNFENAGYYLPDFKKKSYARSLSRITPFFRVMASAEVTASASVGPGIRFEFPAFLIKEGGKWRYSWAGVYALGTVRGNVKVDSSFDPFSGSAAVTCSGKGEFVAQAALQGEFGFLDNAVADADLRLDLYSTTLAEWNWRYYTESPTPYNLMAEVNGPKALLSWEAHDSSKYQRITYDVYVDKGDGLRLYQEGTREKSVEFVSEQDGTYHWAVVARSAFGKKFTSEQSTFHITDTKVKTEQPEIHSRERRVVFSASYTTRNPVKEFGFAFSDVEDFSADIHDNVGKGTADHFTLEWEDFYNHDKVFARAYVKILCPDGEILKVYGNTVMASIDEEEVNLELSPEDLIFGDVAVGNKKTLELLVHNVGIEAGRVKVSVSDKDLPISYDWEDRVLQVDGRATLYVTYTPDKIRQEWKTYLILDAYDKDGRHINRNSVPMTGSSSKEETAKPVFRFSEYSAPFDEVEVGKTGQITRTIYNVGTADLVITAVSCEESAFTTSWTSATIKPNKSQDVTITFRPKEAKRYTAKMQFVCNVDKAEDATLGVTGTGVTPAEPKLQVSRTYLEFEDTQVGQSSQLDWTITNVGNSKLTVSSLTVPNGFSTDFSSWSSKSLNPNESHTFKVTFKPTEAKDYSGKMVLESNASNNQNASFTIGGKGVVAAEAEAKLKVSRTYLEFEDTQVGQSSQLDWTITNVGNAKLTVSSLTVPSGFSTDFSGWSSKSLNPNESHTFKVTFKPTEAKDYSGKMVLNSNASNNQNASFTIGGKGVAAAGEPKIGISPTSVKFGEVAVNTTEESEITITNKGNAPLVFSSISDQDAFTTDFGSWSSKTLEAGQSRKLKVFFKPAAARSYSASISIKTNASNAPDVALPVSGTGVAGATNGALISTGGSLEAFTTIPLGARSEHGLSIYNKGNEPLTIQSIDCPKGFVARLDKWSSQTIPENGHRNLIIEFSPTAEQEYSGVLIIHSNAANYPILSVPVKARCGVNNETFSFSTGLIDFGEVVVGSEEQRINVVVTNHSDRKMEYQMSGSVYGGGLTTVPKGNDNVRSLGPGESKTEVWGFTPEGYSDVNATCRTYINTTGEWVYIDVKGKGISKKIYRGEAVDLGLSVKWANCNLGGGVPEDYGDYYAWGEVELKDSYTDENYKWGDPDSPSVKYDQERDALDLAYDVAHKRLGGKWRMPTAKEFKELIDNCSIQAATKNGVKGYLLTSKINGNSIFLPATGVLVYNLHRDSKPYYWDLAHYWSSSKCRLLSIDTEADGIFYNVGGSSASWGQSIRPVAE